MRKGWEYKKLGEVCTIKAGYTPKKNELSDNGAYPYYKVADMNTLGNDVYLDITSSYKIDANKLFPKGAIVFPKNGAAVSTNKKRILKYDSIVDLNTGVAIFSKSINEKFAYYWFIDTDFKKYVRGGALPTLDIKSLKDKPFPSIDKSTQLAIISELDKINELIRLKKEQLKDFDNLAQSLFYEMFGDPVENEKGWEVKKLNDICDVRDGTHDSPKYLQNSEYILITSKNIVNGTIDFENVNYISEEDYIKINKRSKVDNGDIIMPMIGTIGNPIIAHIDGTHKFCIKNVALIKFLADSTVNNMFIVNLMRCSSFSSYLLNQNKGGTQKFVALGAIRKLPIPLPPLSLQRLFAQRIEQIEREKSEVQKSIQDLETLLASRMQYWFE